MACFNRYVSLSMGGFRKALDFKSSKNSELALVKFVGGQFHVSRRCQGTNWAVWNPQANLRENRDRDPRIMDMMTRNVLRPRLPESILPTYMLPEKDCPPWPYREKGYRYIDMFWDGTLKRFDENTRLVVVEGNVGTGCEAFASELAKRLGFHYIPQPQIEDILVDRYGIDKRDYYHLLPEKLCFFDTEMFFTAPDHPMVNMRQFMLYQMKHEAYHNALAHMLNTGQGVVLTRSVFTDVAFVYAMYEKGFVNGYYAGFYPKMRAESLIPFKLLPHLVIHLDCPPSVCMENVKKRQRPWEIDSKVIDYDYFCAIEDELKRCIKKASKDSAILTLDWKTPADMDSVLDEVYKIDFTYDWNVSDRFMQWNLVAYDYAWNELRYAYTHKLYMNYFLNQIFFDVPELVLYSDEIDHFRFVMEKVIGKYSIGYNRERGDKLWDILFKSNEESMTGTWHEYIFKESIWCVPYNTIIYFEKPPKPNIPDEEFLPRRFDPASLKNWKAAH